LLKGLRLCGIAFVIRAIVGVEKSFGRLIVRSVSDPLSMGRPYRITL